MVKILESKYEDNLKFLVTFLVDKAEYEPWRDRLVDRMLEKVEVPGFRPGKAPREKLLQNVNQVALNQTILQETIQKYGGEAVEQVKATVTEDKRVSVGYEINLDPQVTKETEEGFQFQIVARLLPEMEIEAIQKIKPKEPKDQETGKPKFEDYLKEEKSKLLLNYNQYEETESGASEGDQAVVDMSGEVDGEENKMLESKDSAIVLGSGRFLPDFEKGVKDIKKGEEKSFEVNFPADYFEPTLAGKKAVFKVNCKTVKKPKFKDLEDLIAGNEQLKQQFTDVKGFEAFLEKFFNDETNKRLEDLKQRYILREVVDTVPDFDLDEKQIEAEVERIFTFLQNDSKSKGVSIGQAFAGSGLPGSEDPKIASKDEIEVKKLVESYVRGEFKLSYIFSYVYETKVDDKPSSEQIENTVKQVSANPEAFGFTKDSSHDDIHRGVVDRIVKQLAAKWIFEEVEKNK